MNLEALFDSLESPSTSASNSARFSAVPIPGCEKHRLGKDSRGHPLLLVAVIDAPGVARPAPIALKHLSVQHHLNCRILRSDGSTEQGVFTAIHCNGKDRVLVAYFLHVANALLTSLLAAPSSEDVAMAIDKLVELFRAMSELPRKSVQGLWAELFCMARSREPGVLARAWHQTPYDRYDFCDGGQRIEVKSAARGIRQHLFSLDQLHPPDGTTVLVASLFVEPSGGGLSIADLADQLRSRLNDPKLVSHLDRIIALTLGENWRSAIEDRFDQEAAERSLAFYDVCTIPSLSMDLPPGVRDVRFRSDLSASPSVDYPRYRAQGGLFRAILTRR